MNTYTSARTPEKSLLNGWNGRDWSEGYLFRRMTARGDNLYRDKQTGEPYALTHDGVRRIIKSCAARVGLTEKVSGHSARIGSGCVPRTGWRVACRYSDCGSVERPRYASTLRPRPVRGKGRNRTIQRRQAIISGYTSRFEGTLFCRNDPPGRDTLHKTIRKPKTK